ncbi:MAG: restriction endonuclease [Gemmatimonadetes bacterium]|nr:restriction endonuclease [Gemmatimonadota bacterium]
MKLAFTDETHHNAGIEWENRMLMEWIKGVFESPMIKIERQCSSNIRQHVETIFINDGWALNVDVAQHHRLKVFAQKDDVAFQLQTGNMSRAPYDLLKLQYLFQKERIKVAAIGLPTLNASKLIGDNIANADRIVRELKLFNQVITVPILVLAFD